MHAKIGRLNINQMLIGSGRYVEGMGYLVSIVEKSASILQQYTILQNCVYKIV